MAMTPERRVKREVAKILDAYNVYYFFPATGGFGRSGVPDIVACFQGHFIGIECKAGKNTTTALQDRELRAIEYNGGTTLVVNEHCIEQVREILEGFMDGES